MGKKSVIKTQLPEWLRNQIIEKIRKGKLTQKEIAEWADSQIDDFHITERMIQRFCYDVKDEVSLLTKIGIPVDIANKYHAEILEAAVSLFLNRYNSRKAVAAEKKADRLIKKIINEEREMV